MQKSSSEFAPSSIGSPNETLGDRRQQKRRKSDQSLVDAINRRNKARSLRTSGIYLALLFFTASAFLGFGSNDYGEFSMSNFTSKWNSLFEEESEFDLNGVSLGMTPDRIQEIYPELSTQMSSNGAMKGHYEKDGASYNIAFQEYNGALRASLIHYNKIFKKMNEKQILDHISKKFGKPVSTECARSAYRKSVNCKFLWWLQGGATLTVTSTQVRQASGEASTRLTMIAADSYLEGKKIRAIHKKSRARNISITPLNAITPANIYAESLPF